MCSHDNVVRLFDMSILEDDGEESEEEEEKDSSDSDESEKEEKKESKKRKEKPIPAKNLKRQKVEKKDTGFFDDLSCVYNKYMLYYNYIREKYCRIHHSVMFTPNSIKHRTTHTAQPPTTKMTNGVLMKGRSRIHCSSHYVHM